MDRSAEELTKTPFVLNDLLEAEPDVTRISQALAFYREVLQAGPRLTSEVMREGRRRGLSHRTQWRARHQLNVQSLHLPGMGTRWLIALPGDPAVAAYKQGKRAKTRQSKKPGTASQTLSTAGGRADGHTCVAPHPRRQSSTEARP